MSARLPLLVAIAVAALWFAFGPPGVAGDSEPQSQPGGRPQTRPQPQSQPRDPWSAFCDRLDVQPENLQLSKTRWRGGGRHTMPAFEHAWENWHELDRQARRLDDVSGDAVTFEHLLVAAGNQTGLEFLREHPGLQPAPASGPLQHRMLDIVLRLHADAGDPLDIGRIVDLMLRVAGLPDATLRPLVTVLEAVPEMLLHRPVIFHAKPMREWVEPVTRFGFGYRVDDTSKLLNEHFDLGRAITWALGIARAVDAAVDQIRKHGLPGRRFDWTTPLGRITVGGRGNDRYQAEDGNGAPYLLLLEPGGNDHYAVGSGTRDRDPHPLQVLIDCAGNDTHEDERYGGFSSALLGLAFTRDLAGDDRWSAPYLGPAAAIAGVGMLIDDAGNDHYESRRLGQGAAVLGVAVLADRAGDDTYQTVQMSQGFGGPKGVGILLDEAGNDSYTADDTNIEFPSPQTAEHNTSLSQGCGFGRRAHPGDQYSLAGGIGVLCDRAGNDTYYAGLFSQGAAYWYALGILHDEAGNDRYRGVWYSQGTGAHFASAALIDRAGDDHYHALMHQSQGAGHDFSNGLLRDDAGTDEYRSDGTNVQGFGNANGVGILWDRGNAPDRYLSRNVRARGAVNSFSPGHPCVGALLDEGGDNDFPVNDPHARAHTHWRRPTPPNRPQALGAGWSR